MRTPPHHARHGLQGGRGNLGRRLGTVTGQRLGPRRCGFAGCRLGHLRLDANPHLQQQGAHSLLRCRDAHTTHPQPGQRCISCVRPRRRLGARGFQQTLLHGFDRLYRTGWRNYLGQRDLHRSQHAGHRSFRPQSGRSGLELQGEDFHHLGRTLLYPSHSRLGGLLPV